MVGRFVAVMNGPGGTDVEQSATRCVVGIVRGADVDEHGHVHGGPMYYINKALGWKALATLFSIGVTINWDVIEKHRIEPKARPYPHPGLLLRIDWPSGAKSYFTHAQQMWDAFKAGDLPAFVRGVNLVHIDENTDEWNEYYGRAGLAPVHEPA